MTPASPLPFVGFTLTLPDALTVVEANPQPFNNTKEVVILNTSTTDRVFVKIVCLEGTPPVLPAAVTVDLLTSTLLPVGQSFSFCIGPEGIRNAFGTVAFWTANPGSRLAIVLKAESGLNIEVNITYLQTVGGVGGGPGSC